MECPIGINTLYKFPGIVAKTLSLAGHYTGHCLRRSAATILANNGCNSLQLKRLGRWKSDSVAESHIDNSKASKIEIANMIGSSKNSDTSVIGTSSGLNNCSFQNCSIIFNYK